MIVASIRARGVNTFTPPSTPRYCWPGEVAAWNETGSLCYWPHCFLRSSLFFTVLIASSLSFTVLIASSLSFHWFVDLFGSKLIEVIWFFCSFLSLCSLSVLSLFLHWSTWANIAESSTNTPRENCTKKRLFFRHKTKKKEKVLPLYNVMLEYRIGTP